MNEWRERTKDRLPARAHQMAARRKAWREKTDRDTRSLHGDAKQHFHPNRMLKYPLLLPPPIDGQLLFTMPCQPPIREPAAHAYVAPRNGTKRPKHFLFTCKDSGEIHPSRGCRRFSRGCDGGGPRDSSRNFSCSSQHLSFVRGDRNTHTPTIGSTVIVSSLYSGAAVRKGLRSWPAFPELYKSRHVQRPRSKVGKSTTHTYAFEGMIINQQQQQQQQPGTQILTASLRKHLTSGTTARGRSTANPVNINTRPAVSEAPSPPSWPTSSTRGRTSNPSPPSARRAPPLPLSFSCSTIDMTHTSAEAPSFLVK